jgi:hypothetical protein
MNMQAKKSFPNRELTVSVTIVSVMLISFSVVTVRTTRFNIQKFHILPTGRIFVSLLRIRG